MDYTERKNRFNNGVFKNFRRIHGHNLDSGLNDLTEAFAAFMTRAKYFSIGHLRRTWSHSAVEFMKYRRRLPALLAASDDESDFVQNAGELGRNNSLIAGDASFPSTTSAAAARRLYVSNIPGKVTTTQLASFFSKFGRVVSSSMPVDRGTCTLPRKSRGCAYVTFQTVEGATRALNAAPVELIFYNKMMSIAPSSKSPCLRMADRQSTSDVDHASLSESESELASSVSPASPMPSESTAEAAPYQAFNALPDNIWSQIFAYLNIFDRVRIERTCKRWQELSFDSWSHNPSLQLRYHFGIGRSSKALNNNILRSLLHRCGPYLKHLDLCGAVQFLNDYSLVVIAECCKQLVSINFTGLKTQWSALKVFAEACGSTLESVTLRDAYFLSENAFWWLCRSCPNLKMVDFGHCRKISTGKCFRSINKDIESFKLDGCRRLEASAIQELCLRCTKLKRLNLDDCIKIDDHSLSLLSRSLCCLEQLSLKSTQSCPPHSFGYTSAGLKQLTRLEHLASLHLNRNPVVDDSVLYELFVKSWGLKRLTIPNAGNGQITKKCLNDVFSSAQLSLVELDMSFLPLNDVIVENIARRLCSTLQVLRLRGLTQISDRSIEVLAENCASLMTLDLTDCLSISNSSINKFFYTHRCTPGKSWALLTIILGGTSCDLPKLIQNLEMSQNAGRIVLSHAARAYKPLVEDASSTLSSFHDHVRGASTERFKKFSLDDISPSDNSADDCDPDDEFESLIAQRSYVLDELEEDDLSSEVDENLNEEFLNAPNP